VKKLFLFVILSSIASIDCTQTPSVLVDAIQFDKHIQEIKELQLIDVRTANEFKSGHISGAVNIDFYRSDFKQMIAQLDTSKPIAVYCAVGGRSGSTAKIAADLGFKTIYDLEGGISLWQKQGLKIVKD
jgi:phage shock protein E